MKTLNKGIALAVLVTVGATCQTASAMPAAMAGAGFGSVAGEMSARPVETVGGRRHGGRYYRGGWDNGNAAAAAATAGVIGLAAGAILGGALASPNRCYGAGCYGYAAPPQRVYVAPPVYAAPPPVYAAPVYPAPVYVAPERYARPPVVYERAPTIVYESSPYVSPPTDPSGCYDVGARVVCQPY